MTTTTDILTHAERQWLMRINDATRVWITMTDEIAIEKRDKTMQVLGPIDQVLSGVRSHIGIDYVRLAADLATLRQQRDELLAAAKRLLPILEDAALRITETSRHKNDSGFAKRVDDTRKNLLSIIISQLGWDVQPASLYDEEGVEGWLWTSPDGREFTEIGDWNDVPTLPEELRAAIAKCEG